MVDLGYKTARDYSDNIVSAAYSRFLKIKNRENAIAAAKAISDLRDWLWHDTHPAVDPRDDVDGYKAFTAALFSDCPELELLRDIADGAKHGSKLGRKNVKVARITGSGSPGGTLYEFSPLGMNESTPACHLEIDVGDGVSHKLPEVLERAMRYWQKKLA
jgi:hypothetical protein